MFDHRAIYVYFCKRKLSQFVYFSLILREREETETNYYAPCSILTFSSILDMYFFDPSLDCLVGLTSYIKAGLMNYEGIFIYNIMLLHSRPCLPPCTRMRPVLQQNSLQVFSCLPLSPPLCSPQFCTKLVYKATLSFKVEKI